MAKNDDWKCCKCPKNKAHKHEELWSFGPYGDNPLKKEDSEQYCEEHFLKREEELDRAYSKSRS